MYEITPEYVEWLENDRDTFEEGLSQAIQVNQKQEEIIEAQKKRLEDLHHLAGLRQSQVLQAVPVLLEAIEREQSNETGSH